MAPNKCERLAISSATAQGLLQQILKSPKTLSGPCSYHESEKQRCFYKGYFGQNKDFKGNFSKNKEGANVQPCNSFREQMSLMPFFMGGQMSVRAFVHTPCFIGVFQYHLIC